MRVDAEHPAYWKGEEKVLRIIWTTLITLALCVDCMAVNWRPRNYDQQLTDAELQQVQQLAVQFTASFARNRDIAPATKELFLKDFIERYLKGKANALAGLQPSNLNFIPGLVYNSRLHTEASREDWLRFYTAANNFMFFGIEAVLKNPPKADNIRPADLYPASVVSLLDTNPSLSNMLERKERTTPVSSVADMQKATAILGEAVALMRQQPQWQTALKIDEPKLLKAMKEDTYFRPTIRTIDDQFFDLPQGSKLIVINTPILFRLLIVKSNNRFEILWAEPVR